MPDTPPETDKQRELFFSSDPPGQTERAYELLRGLEGLKVERGNHPDSLLVSYSLTDYSLDGLEQALLKEGFHFDDGVLQQISKKLIHYCEDVQYHNLNTPERKTKSREREIFVRVYDHHPHGDHDDTPEELRENK
ncbi:MAG: hypothetical protein GC139_09820 [Sideroxydans sp.]|nr:hypothetical protein [Sideroxydans sp.]